MADRTRNALGTRTTWLLLGVAGCASPAPAPRVVPAPAVRLEPANPPTERPPPPPLPEPPPEAKEPHGLARLCGEREPTLLDLNGQSYATCCAVGPATTLACTLGEAHQHSPFLTSDLLFVDLVGGARWRTLGAILGNLGMSQGAKLIVGLDAVPAEDGFELRVSNPAECTKRHCNGGIVARGDDFVGTTQCVPVQKLCAAAGRYRWDRQGFPRRVSSSAP